MEVALSPPFYDEVMGAGEEPYSPSWGEEGSQEGDPPLVIDEGGGEDREDLDDRLLRMLHQDSLPSFLVDFAELSRREEARKDGGRTAGRRRSSGRKTSRQKVSGKKKNTEDFLKTVRRQLASVMREEVRRGLLDMLVEDVTDWVLVQQGQKTVDEVDHMVAYKEGHMVVVDEDCHKGVAKEDHKVAVYEEGNWVVDKDGHMVVDKVGYTVVDKVGYKVVDEEDHKVVIDKEGSSAVDEEGHKVVYEEGHKVVDEEDHTVMDEEGHTVVYEDGHKVMYEEGHKVVDEEDHMVVDEEGHTVVDEDGHKVVDEEGHKVVDEEGHKEVVEVGHKVVVWPVDQDVPGKDLWASFQGCGQILDVKNTLKGFAIIAFSCQESCGVAVKEVQGCRVAGRKVSVKEMVRRLGGVGEH